MAAGGLAVLNDLRAALGFLTRLSVGAARLEGGLGRAALWFPVVGAVVGGLAAGVRWVGDDVLGLAAGPSTLLAVLAAVVVTGALHEDGLADCADGFGAHVDRARRLEVMRDPRVGTFGAIALVVVVLLPVLALGPLTTGDFAVAVVSAHVLGRWALLAHARALGPAEPGSSAALLTPPLAVAVAGSIVSAAAVVALCGEDAVAALATALAVVALWSAVTGRVLGGMTGDTLGAGAKLVELGVAVALGTALGG
ncbi:adenosylcobinamide-GDP ribazoletransferase [Conexibacter sp. SYSU D00693]|uniref:adenosylcobinamide-GDP ribazoletransferase n=1 Tax=Conexibacter sp. SYSU D00693 TaxID=2812560 RepID=UPI00196A7C52|nr:adenosylcobinamide-GDP ribazoletransferase [Conexibacter sp. SYSU D00693]